MQRKRKEFRKLISIEEAKEIMNSLAIKHRIEKVPLEKAYNCILAENIVSKVDVPSFDRASMDGYAVKAEDTYLAREDNPITLKVIGSLEPGIIPDKVVRSGEAVEISTGSVMPIGANAVVMVEYTSQLNSDVIIKRPVSPNENVMHAGADIMIGELVLRKGTLLTPREIGVLSAIGIGEVPVKVVKVGILSTGNELIEPSETLQKGKIYDTNSYAIASAVMEFGGSPKIYGIIPDNENAIHRALKTAYSECDFVLTSGSTSAGVGDILYKTIDDLGKILVHGINIKPGKPMIIGVINKVPVIGLPGYPVSALTTFKEFVGPKISEVIGKLKQEKKYITAKLAVPIRSDRHELLPIGLHKDKVYPVSKGSGAITTLADADGYIEIPPDIKILEKGDIVKVTLFGDFKQSDILFLGSHCIGVDILSEIIPYSIKIISTGSRNGISAIRNGIADIAGVHLLDQDTGIYNNITPNNATLIKGYVREQGLIFRKDCDIKSIGDILDKKIINRQKGSGTRVLFDLMLKELANKLNIPFRDLCNKIDGYGHEAKTHSAVASAIKQGIAEVGFGIRPYAELNGLQFIKIAEEEYDFLILKERLDSVEVQSFLDALHSKAFKERLPVGLQL